jgi:hypothetical protein
MHILDRQELNAGWVLPESYGVDRMVLLPREPYWLYSYWEISPNLLTKMQSAYGPAWSEGRTILRIYDMDSGTDFDTELPLSTHSWHIPVAGSDHCYRAELGQILADERFIPLVSSNTVRTPRDSISAAIDTRWKMFAFWQQRFYKKMLIGLSSFELFSRENDRLN